MRRYQQKQILDLIETFREAQSAGLYAEAQDGALALGEFIDYTAGEGTKTDELLTQYCELLFKASNGEVGEKALRKHLIKVDNAVREELKPNKIEIAFLSYNASMSDCIMSVYQAAKADPNCDAYWIPIPYYERNPDGSFGEIHYEGAENYPNIECVDWQKYDIEARRPDVVVSFAPYDEGNYVTSVHPNFYFKRLRGLTDLLIYTPYFVVADDVPEHFCTVAGCVYAHKVIVQSENIREKYIQNFKNAFGHKLGRPEDKFIALGSPKFDAVINTKRENCELPNEWRELIGDKKVIFYNTTVGAILAGNEQYLKKLRSVIEVFRAREDVVLWWRPHPLSEQTYDSMRRNLSDEYRAIVAEYNRAGFGIFDDTPDLHRAIAWSDAYYGDMSSVVTLYQVTGKPIMIADVFSNTSAEGIKLMTENICDDGERLWFTSYNYNSLWSIHKVSNKIEHMGFFPTEETFKFRQYFSLIKVRGSLFAVPHSADYIAEYSIANCSFRTIAIPECDNHNRSKVKYDSKYKFLCGYEYDEFIYFTPSTYPGILKYSIKSGNIEVLDGWIPELSNLIIQDSRGYFSRGVVIGEKLYLACTGANAIFELDMSNDTCRIHRINNSNLGYYGICYDGGSSFWLVPVNNGTVVNWNPSTGAHSEYDITSHAENDTLYPYVNVCKVGIYIWLFPCRGKDVIKIDTRTGEVATGVAFNYDNETEETLSRIVDCNFIMQECFNDTVYAFSLNTNDLIVFNPMTMEITRQKLLLPNTDDDGFGMSLYQCKNCVNSNFENTLFYENSISVINFLNGVVSDSEPQIASQTMRDAGEKIFKFVKRMTLKQ